MRHYGDVRAISGRDVPPVEVIIGGSPCQDLSIAGKRKGFDGERSSLFLEQIRIIREMREKDAESGRTGIDIRPRFMVWENVPGAFSSNGGRDFQRVLEETVRTAEPEAPDIPVPRKGWTHSGCIMGAGFSVAWRVFDAQFWGVPQRRRRIALIADFGGQSAPEVLFERKGLQGYSEQGEAQRKETARGTGKGTETASWCLNPHDSQNQRVFPMGKVWHTLTSRQNRDLILAPKGFALGFRAENTKLYDECATTLCNGTRAGFTVAVVYKCQSFGEYKESEIGGTIKAQSDLTNSDIVQNGYTVRRMTPTEYERLQGFPDGWTDIGEYTDTKGRKRTASDTARYKALGNSIALPCWFWVLYRLNEYCTQHTMGSLFDGIGGFPLIWEHLNGKGSAVWCSEIEEYCIAVTKRRFGND